MIRYQMRWQALITMRVIKRQNACNIAAMGRPGSGTLGTPDSLLRAICKRSGPEAVKDGTHASTGKRLMRKIRSSGKSKASWPEDFC